jgi:poly(3-hydroxybutyrate) depolymerase
MTRSIFNGSTTIAIGLLLAAAAGCGSSTGSGTTGTAGSSAGSAGTSGAAGTGGTTGAGAAGTGGNSTGAAGTGGGAAGRGGSSAAGTTGSAGNSGSAGSGAGGAAMPSAGCGTTPATTAETTYMIDVSGTSRSYIVTLPANYNASQPHQLVFAWHGRTGTAMQIARGNYYGLKSRMTNAIFVAGQGLGTTADANDTGWPNTNGQDIAFVRAALAWMNTNYCVDQARVFSVGFSYGGIMSHTIACQMSDTFRAVAPIAGAIFGRPTCLTHPIAAWMTHGSMDTSASGGVDFTAGESARDRIVALNHCTATTVAADPSPCVAYQGCDAGYPVQWCAHDGAHMVPSFAAAAIATFFLQF